MNPFYWTKRIGERHILYGGQTYCGRPALGNNYARERTDAKPCEECEQKFNDEKQLYEEKAVRHA